MDYSQQVDDLRAADQICMRHVITTSINGVQAPYPRWPNAFADCERIHQWWIETETMARDGSDDDDRNAVADEARRLKGFGR